MREKIKKIVKLIYKILLILYSLFIILGILLPSASYIPAQDRLINKIEIIIIFLSTVPLLFFIGGIFGSFKNFKILSNKKLKFKIITIFISSLISFIFIGVMFDITSSKYSKEYVQIMKERRLEEQKRKKEKLAKAKKEKKKQEELAKAKKEKKKQEELAKAKKEKKKQEELAKAKKEKKKQEELAKAEKEKKKQEELAKAKKEKKKQEELAKAEKEKKKQEELAKAEEEKKKQEELAKAEEEKKKQEELAKAEEEEKKKQEELDKIEEEKKNEESTINNSEFKSAIGNLYPGVTLYAEDNGHMEAYFTVVKKGKNVSNPGASLIKNGVLVKEILSGDTYWKDVDRMIKNSLSDEQYIIKYYVKKDDPYLP